MAIRVGFLLLASLSGVTADGYDLGGEDAICWLTQTTLATNNPNGTLPDRVGAWIMMSPDRALSGSCYHVL